MLTTRASYCILIALLLLSSRSGEGQVPPSTSPSSSEELILRAGPDESSAIVASVRRGETLSPVAEMSAGEGAKWYLIKTSNGTIGWIKKTDDEQSKKLEKFFKPLPLEAPASGTLQVDSGSSLSDSPGTIRVAVQMTGASVIVPVTLNRRLKTFLVLDTGATTTMISQRVANNLGLRTDGPRVVATTVNGHVAVPLARLGSIKVGDAEVHNLAVTVHDLSPATRADGLLGLDFLKRFHVSIDARNQLLILTPH